MGYLPGKGTLLKLNGSTIAQRVKLEGPDSKVGEADVTHLDSTFKEFRPTIPEAGNISGTLLYDPADTTHQDMEALRNVPSTEAWELEFSDGSSDAFDGFLMEWKKSGMEVEKYVEAEFKIRITGLITFTAAP